MLQGKPTYLPLHRRESPHPSISDEVSSPTTSSDVRQGNSGRAMSQLEPDFEPFFKSETVRFSPDVGNTNIPKKTHVYDMGAHFPPSSSPNQVIEQSGHYTNRLHTDDAYDNFNFFFIY